MKNKLGLFTEVLTDPKHYLGWFLDIVLIVAVAALFGVKLYAPFYLPAVMYVVLMMIDVANHIGKLQ